MLYCASLLEKSVLKKKRQKNKPTTNKKKTTRGTLRKVTVLTCYALLCCFVLGFFSFSFGERELWWTQSDSAGNPRALRSVVLSFVFSLELISVWERKSKHSLGLQRAINIHRQWIRMGWSSELCRALTLSPLLRCTYNVKIWSDFFFLVCFFWLNSIFYRFCRHFVVGRKK